MQAGRLRGVASTEIVLVIGVILIAGVFLASVQRIGGSGAETSNQLDVEETADRIARFLEETSKGDMYMNVCVSFPSATIWVRDNVLYVKRGDYTASRPLSGEWWDYGPVVTDRECMNSDINAVFRGYNPNCKNDGTCNPEECSGCQDCDGPDPACIGDGSCNPSIGESCLNSQDCACDPNTQYCAPMNPSSDSKGCVTGTPHSLSEGDQCYGDIECPVGEACTTTSVSFNGYYYACCPEGSSWDGSSCVQGDKLSVLFVPLNWQGSRDSFERAAREHFKFFVMDSGIDLKNCPSRAKYYADYDATRCTSNALGRTSCNEGRVLLDILACARQSGVSYDYVVGLSDWDVCGSTAGFSTRSSDAVMAESSASLITAHELGHKFGLNDEYVDACSCGYGLVNPSANCLNPNLGGDEEVPGVTDGVCVGNQCPPSYDVTCLGNKNAKGGRCVMSFVRAPGPRMFCQECLAHLGTIPALSCS